jgi:two-component system sensor histidine kinase LytS
MKELAYGLVNRLSIFILLILVCIRLEPIKKIIAKKKVTNYDRLIFTAIFGLFGIMGTYFSIPFQGALVNTRILGIMAGGLLGGPIVGLGVGTIAGFHRWVIDIGGFTSVACGISAAFEGLFGGLAHSRFNASKNKWLFALGMGAFGEGFRKIMVLVFARPWDRAVLLVKNITVPMVVVNSIGLSLFIVFLTSYIKEEEKREAERASIILDIANQTLPYLRKGFNANTAYHTAKLIFSKTDFDAVVVTDKDRILCARGLFIAKGSLPSLTPELQRIIASQECRILNNMEGISMPQELEKIESAVVMPLNEGSDNVGAIILGNFSPYSITSLDIEIAQGLARLFSTQLELSRIEYQKKLIARSELRALQAQINPHFLFNALSSIGAMCRIDPETSRKLIIHLANYFRNTLKKADDFVSLQSEIENVKSYVAIEQARFSEKLRINYNIDINPGSYIPPFVLQPLVENAIIHGLLPRKTGGEINISVTEEKNKVVFVVEDNGVGIPKEKFPNVLKEDKGDSLGLRIVNSRLKYLYQSNYSLDIQSVPGKGTRVTLIIPKTPTEREVYYDKNSTG